MNMCFYCDFPVCLGAGTTLDHVLPKSKGGDDGPLNTVLCCWECNRKKARTIFDDKKLVLFKENRKQYMITNNKVSFARFRPVYIGLND